MRSIKILVAPVLIVTWVGTQSSSGSGSIVRADSSITVPAGADLQLAINTARPGDAILLEAGAAYIGNFSLPARTGNDERPITLQTALPGGVAVGRITPDQAANFASIQSPNNAPALRTAPGARFWHVQFVEFRANRGGVGDIITLGDGSSAQNRTEGIPSDLVFDRVYIHGDPAAGQKRAIALNSARTAITNSYIADIKTVGEDSQAIAGWNGPGDYQIVNNYLEAAGENVLFGGADPSVINLVPTNIIVRGNTISKPVEWRDSPWQVKNLLELKNARNVTIEQNVIQHCWPAAQTGFAILFNTRNQGGTCPWCQVEKVMFRNNLVRGIAAGISILGYDDLNPSQQTNHITISNNVVDGLDYTEWGGNGYLLMFTGTPRDVTVDHNTVIQGGSQGVAFLDDHVDGLVVTNNLASHGEYGIIGTNHGPGNDSIRALAAGSTITANVLAGGDPASYPYPPGNMFPSLNDFRAQFVNYSAHDYRLRTGSSWTTAATDHRSLGADVNTVPSASDPQTPPSRQPHGRRGPGGAQ